MQDLSSMDVGQSVSFDSLSLEIDLISKCSPFSNSMNTFSLNLLSEITIFNIFYSDITILKLNFLRQQVTINQKHRNHNSESFF